MGSLEQGSWHAPLPPTPPHPHPWSLPRAQKEAYGPHSANCSEPPVGAPLSTGERLSAHLLLAEAENKQKTDMNFSL